MYGKKAAHGNSDVGSPGRQKQKSHAKNPLKYPHKSPSTSNQSTSSSQPIFQPTILKHSDNPNRTEQSDATSASHISIPTILQKPQSSSSIQDLNSPKILSSPNEHSLSFPSMPTANESSNFADLSKPFPSSSKPPSSTSPKIISNSSSRHVILSNSKSASTEPGSQKVPLYPSNGLQPATASASSNISPNDSKIPIGSSTPIDRKSQYPPSPIHQPPPRHEPGTSSPSIEISSPAFGGALRLLNEQHQFIPFLGEEMKLFLDKAAEVLGSGDHDIKVIAAIGRQGAGKSTLLNALCQKRYSGHWPTDSKTETTNQSHLPHFPFKIYPSFTPGTSLPSSAPALSKQLVLGSGSFSIEMSILRPESPWNTFKNTPAANPYMSSDNSPTGDCLVLLDVQAMVTPSALAALKKNEPPLPSAEFRSYEHWLHFISLQIGLWVLSVSNLLLVVDDKPAGDLELWNYMKTLDLLKWSIPDISATLSSNNVVSQVIPSLKSSFFNSQIPETYIKLMVDIASKMSAPAAPSPQSVPPSVSKKTLKRDKQSTSLMKPLPKEEEAMQSLEFSEEALDEMISIFTTMNPYSPSREYIPSIMFVYNRINPYSNTAEIQKQISAAIRSFFSETRFQFDPDGPPLEASRSSIIAFVGDFTQKSWQYLSVEDDLRHFVRTVLATEIPKFNKRMNLREWIVAASKCWDIVKHSPVLADYNDILKISTFKSQKTGTANTADPYSSYPSAKLTPSLENT